ncbi:hypothetical protein D3791_10060 [Glutamicibacter mishrai]|uniref:Uncharacterized protein n=1 Tax=Glutamicibacter mishrai TaxID=1775880 RepID=A0A6H0SJD6_9MICC|nr:hypothetical protein D3791_10060 [Glutamicibacter mishrai]
MEGQYLYGNSRKGRFPDGEPHSASWPARSSSAGIDGDPTTDDPPAVAGRSTGNSAGCQAHFDVLVACQTAAPSAGRQGSGSGFSRFRSGRDAAVVPNPGPAAANFTWRVWPMLVTLLKLQDPRPSSASAEPPSLTAT